jgi:glutamyl-tRNA(Gln) amidotransferase subunit D
MQKLNVGDLVKIFGNGFQYSGLVMPSQEESLVILKLDNGYNVGISAKNIQKVQLVGKSRKPASQLPKMKSDSKLPNITIVTTGGTITSRVDYKTGAVSPLTNPEELIANVPEVAKLANIKIVSPFSKLSEAMLPEDWQKIADAVALEINKGVDGVIVTHGTDTLHYTSAALSFMLKDLPKPVALVGGQRSSDRGGFDGAQNLVCAVHYCLSQIAEVAIIMHANTDDDYCYALRGTKVRKMNSSRRDAFRPINSLPLAKIDPKNGVEILAKSFRIRTNKRVKVDSRLQPKVALIKYTPGLSPDILGYYVDKGYKGVVLEGTGFGHTSGKGWLKAIAQATKHVVVCMTTQTLYGTTNNHIYSSGVELHKVGVIYCRDTLSETAYVKLMYLLGTNNNLEEVKRAMTQNTSGEISNRIEKKSFLF